MSLLSENDLDALRKITGIDTITWKDYKMKRYENAAQKLDEIPYFDSSEVIRMFKEAFEADSRNGRLSQSIDLKRTLFGIVKRATCLLYTSTSAFCLSKINSSSRDSVAVT